MPSHSDIDRAIANVLKYAAREPWAQRRAAYFMDRLSGVLARFALTREQLIAGISRLESAGMLFGFLFESFSTEAFDDPAASLIGEYLKRRGWQETPLARRYLEALRDSLPSLYEVIDVRPAEWVEVRDVVRATPVQRVLEVAASQQLCKWDRLGARVLDVNGELLFAGGVLHFPRDAADDVQRILMGSVARFEKTFGDLIEPHIEARSPTAFADEVLRSSSRAFVEVWLSHALDVSSRPAPELQNTDGHPLLLSHVRLPVKGDDLDEVTVRLSALKDWEREGPDVRTWQRQGGPLGNAARKTVQKGKRKSKSVSAAAKSPRRAKDAGPQKIVAVARLERDALVIETNSRERMTAALEEVRAALGGLVGEALIRYDNVEAALNTPRSSRRAESELPPGVADSAELAAALQQFKEQHYRRTLDDKIPMLGNRTPRQCARDPKRRAQVVAWLKDIENGEQRQARESGQPAFDVRWMWKELGVEDLG